MSIERLRALEKDLRDDAEDRHRIATKFPPGTMNRTLGEFGAALLTSMADKLSALIAELGQEVGAVACRGYAKLGIGAYLIEHSAESEPAALMLCIASDEEKAGRTVGDLKTFEGERQPIPAEKMTIRIDFANVAGLDALEQQLRLLREVHFPTSPAHTSEARDAATAVVDAVKAIKSNPHVFLGDLVYEVREREGHGWDGQWCKQWGDAVDALDKALSDYDAAMRQEAGDGND